MTDIDFTAIADDIEDYAQQTWEDDLLLSDNDEIYQDAYHLATKITPDDDLVRRDFVANEIYARITSRVHSISCSGCIDCDN